MKFDMFIQYIYIPITVYEMLIVSHQLQNI